MDDHAPLAAFLEGELPPAEAEAFAHHVAACDRCWEAAARDGEVRSRLAAVREPVPDGLAERVLTAVSAQPPPRLAGRIERAIASAHAHGARRAPRRRRIAIAGTLAAAVCASAIVIAWPASSAAPADPAPVSALVKLAASGAALSPGAHLTAGDAALPLSITSARAGGEGILIAESTRPIPELAGSTRLTEPGAYAYAWGAQRGDVTVLCINGRRHVILAGRVPTAVLEATARQLGYL